jgi:hypothetical protein
MVNRQDFPYLPGSPEIAQRPLVAEITFVGTKLALERSRPKTTTHGINCSGSMYLTQFGRIKPDPAGMLRSPVATLPPTPIQGTPF